MANYVKFEPFVQGLADKAFDWFGTGDTFKVAIHSDAPVVATDDELGDLTQITGTGYTAGGEDAQNDATRSGGTVTMVGVDITWTGGAGGFTAGRYFALHDDTSTTDRLQADWDYGGPFTVAVGETMTWNTGASIATLT